MLGKITKISTIFRLFVIRTLQYRGELLIWLLIEASPFLVMFAVWQKIFSQQTTVRGYNLIQMLQYYWFIFIISSITESHFEGTRCQEVRLGKIDFKMIRPFSYFSEIFWQDLSNKFIYFLLGLPIFLLICLSFGQIFNFNDLATVSSPQWLLFVFFIVVSYAINFMIAYWIVLGSFWMEGSQGLEHFKWILVNLFSGMIPLAFLPIWMQKITNLLPFKFMYAVPIGIMQNTYMATRQDISYALSCLLIMIVISRYGWQRAIMKYSSAGG